MIILNDKYAIDVDPYNFILKEKKVKGDKSKLSGQEHWKEVSWHATHEQLIQKMKNLAINEAIGGDFTRLENLVGEIDSIIAKVITLKKPKK